MYDINYLIVNRKYMILIYNMFLKYCRIMDRRKKEIVLRR
jgi:hypothetical protein